jgi:hypothetical protein
MVGGPSSKIKKTPGQAHLGGVPVDGTRWKRIRILYPVFGPAQGSRQCGEVGGAGLSDRSRLDFDIGPGRFDLGIITQGQINGLPESKRRGKIGLHGAWDRFTISGKGETRLEDVRSDA